MSVAGSTGSTEGTWADDERRRRLLARVRACVCRNRVTLAYPPATGAQLCAGETRLCFLLPPLLRLLYTEVANGGPGVGWPDETEAFIGVDGGFSLDPRDPSATLGYLVSHSGWRLHPCIEDALAQHPRHYVVVDSWPDRFVPFAGGSDCPLLDGWSGRVYRG
jgi:hypothetical protein